MVCEGTFWYEVPCTVPYPRAYHSVQDALDDFRSMARDYERFGGAPPVGQIVRTDGAEFNVSLGPRGGIKVARH